MRVTRIWFLLYLVFLSTSPCPSESSAWLQDRGKLLYICNFGASIFDGRIYGSKFKNNEYYNYNNLEYGVAQHTSLGFNAGQKHNQKHFAGYDDNSQSIYLDLYSRSRIMQNDKIVLSIQPRITFLDYSAFELRTLLGYNYKHKGYDNFINAEIGYNIKFGFPHELMLDLTHGVKIGEFVVLSQIFATKYINSETYYITVPLDNKNGQYETFKDPYSYKFSILNKFSVAKKLNANTTLQFATGIHLYNQRYSSTSLETALWFSL